MAELIIIGIFDKQITASLRKNSNFQKISCFDNLIDALRELKDDNIYILLMDIDLQPEFSSFHISLARGMNKNILIVALTADDSLNNIRELKEYNVNEILIKPVTEKKLENLMNNLERKLKQKKSLSIYPDKFQEDKYRCCRR